MLLRMSRGARPGNEFLRFWAMNCGPAIADEKYPLSLHSMDKFDLAPNRLHHGDPARIDYLHLRFARKEGRYPEVVQRSFQHNVVGTEFLSPHYWIQGI
jgi:hypothetical protein